MDIFRWIKREWDTTQSCRRRDSEPVAPVSGNNFNTPRSRDEAYLRALRKFNEWRHKERSASFRSLTRRSSKISSKPSYSEQSTAIVHPAIMKEAKTLEDNNNDDGHLYEELKIPQKPRPKNLFDSAKKFLQKSQSFPANVNNYNNNNVETENTDNVLKCRRKCPVINENDEEVEAFENDHCILTGNIDVDGLRKQTTPPKTFFRDNSHPFKEVKSPVRTNRYALSSFTQPNRLASNANASANDFVRESLPKDKDMTPEAHGNDSKKTSNKYNKYDFNPMAIYENERNSNRNCRSPVYQTVINKHGDLVEYALPFCDQNDEEFDDRNESMKKEDIKSQQVTSDLNASTFPHIEVNGLSKDRRMSQSLCNLNNSTEHQSKRKSMVTDLDKSDEKSKYKAQVDEIFQELESLENWSMRLSNQLEKESRISNEIKRNNLIVCSASDISQRASPFKNTLQGPILLSSGNFRKTTVSLRKTEKRLQIQSERGLMHELHVLNKVKHPNVTLLMAVCLDVNNKILSLVLEPFVANVNSMIYALDHKIMMEDCVEYILQVIKAVIYLHENGFIHSNICSHNILVCENRKVVKLSSFELATAVDVTRIQNDTICTFYGSPEKFRKSILKSTICEKGWSSLISKNKIPHKFLPYLIEYRKLYSEHFYQPPELLSSQKHFVFPTKQADVYGIALLLWEMLNSCVPFGIFSYEEVENLFQLSDSNQLPLFDDDRCKLFETLLQNGLVTLPSSRIENVQSMKFLIDEAKTTLNINGMLPVKLSTREPSIVKSSGVGEYLRQDRTHKVRARNSQLICERASTFRDNYVNRQIQENSITPNIPQIRYNSRSLDDILQGETNSVQRKEYEFQIDEFSLPSTPIARKNKLRRNAWLSNKALYHKSFDETDEDVLDMLNNRNDNGPAITKTKLVNVNIKIIQNKIDKDEALTSSNKPDENALNVSSQIEYWNSITSSHGEIGLKKQNNNELNSSNLENNILRTPESRIEDVGPDEQSTPRYKATNTVERTSVRKPIKDRSKYYPNMPELLSETFLRRSLKDNSDFENTLWKRERERCEKLSPKLNESVNESVETPLRASVKDTVHKFESFTKKDRKIRNILQSQSCRQMNESRDVSVTTSNTISNNTFQITESNALSVPAVDSSVQFLCSNKAYEENISTTKLSINLKKGSPPKLQSPNVASSTSAINDSRKLSELIIPSLCVDAADEHEKATTTCSRKSKPTLFSVNIRKLNRRASDVGCIRKLTKRENSLRHSVCGTDLVKNVAKMNAKTKQPISSDSNLVQKQTKSVTSLAESDIQYCKLTCWKCGSKVFKLDEIAFNEKAIRTKRYLRRFSTSPIPQTGSPDSLRRLLPGSSVERMRSIEDIYIDDDFGSGHESLCANMRLLSPEQDDLFDILSIDFLSTDLFDPIG